MEAFTISPRSLWWIHALRRSNPLVRRSDRVEALASVIAVIVAVVAIPVAGAIGTFVHDSRAQMYREQLQTAHQVVATAVKNGVLVSPPRSLAFVADATWSEFGRTHHGIVPWSDWAKVGDQQLIWVNDVGENVGQPSPPGRAVGEAIGAALLVWLAVAEGAAALLTLVRRRLNHQRFAQWDRELNESYDNDDRRKHK